MVLGIILGCLEKSRQRVWENFVVLVVLPMDEVIQCASSSWNLDYQNYMGVSDPVYIANKTPSTLSL